MICLLLLFMPQLLRTEVIFNKRSWIKDKALNSIIQSARKLLPKMSAFKTQIGEERFGNKSYDVKFHPQFTQPDAEFFSKPENHRRPLAIMYYGMAVSFAFSDMQKWTYSNMNKNSSLLKTSQDMTDRIRNYLDTYSKASVEYFGLKAFRNFKVPASQASFFRHYFKKAEKSEFFQVVKIKGLKKRVCQKSPPSQCEQNVMGFVIVRDFAKLLRSIMRDVNEIIIKR